MGQRCPIGVRQTRARAVTIRIELRMRPDELLPDLEVIRHAPYNAETPERALITPVTASANVYVRTNFDVPALDDAHVISFGGAMRAPFSTDVRALRAMAQRTVGATMECAGNDRLAMHPLPEGEPWRRGAVSTATWTGVPLRALLERAMPNDDTVEIVITAADAGPRDDAAGLVSFARSLSIADAFHDDALIALAMNGAPLTPAHGAPARLVMPGWYGMASVKWITSINAVRLPFDGYFQRQRYVYDEDARITPVTRMRVKSIITSPADGDAVAREFVARGWAWSGDGAITRVEVGLDGGESWRDATLGAPVSAHVWTPWECALQTPRGGRFSLRSRATDASGVTQPDRITWNRLGYGNNAVRTIVVDVA